MQKTLRNILILAVVILCAVSVAIVIIKVPTKEYRTEEETLYPVSHSEPVAPGEMIEQTFIPTDDRIESIAVALSYEDSDITGSVLIQVLDGEKEIASQPLVLAAFTKDVFLPIQVGIEDAKDKQLTVRITNTSENGENICVPITEDSIFLQVKYFKGYYIYMALCYSLWIILGCIVLISLLFMIKEKN